MKLLSNLRIGARLAAGFSAALVMLLLIGSLAVFQVSRVYGGTEAIAGDWLPSVQALVLLCHKNHLQQSDTW